ncbi:hypothetical protein TTHERM_000460503 (macronuclear) [Tetrahymena thermophila SB210]|uniref:Uncharacterized protein n=1 Tax=Tetrahymena thermophila (strain SB210) TaxID=312017 RepID=W7XH80_TETTS|nr:hypothetical protein TTHERM_000460503 [Tetrahymena thermophila SB210]EWS73691.1 hypothetical protein TTHERM_000460503 [Tetrahymena thermophila SB210]|eukprot:XP_012653729.1 hypothetical protein TTHERM_000460503 [Tetrahymena thermophila SB210]
MATYLKSLIRASRGAQKTSMLQTSITFKPSFYASYENKNILKELNKENRELYTREQKLKIDDEEHEKDNQTNFREKDYDERYIEDQSSGYFSREMDNYFKTLNGNKKMQQFDVAEEEDEIISINQEGIRNKKKKY